jgi:hypothetical protein
MLIATWNLNHRVGRTTFRPDAADAAVGLDADILVFTEYFPQHNAQGFSDTLRRAGWDHQLISPSTAAKANRVFIASKHELHHLMLELPAFDLHFPANLLCVYFPGLNLSLIGVRVPWYEKDEMQLIQRSWDWLEGTAAALVGQRAVILGDLNVGLKSGIARGGEQFRRILDSGWHRAAPIDGFSYLGNGSGQSEIDHILGTASCKFGQAQYVTSAGSYTLAGDASAISDHAALIAEVTL